MASETHGSILLSTADSVSRMLMKKLDSQTGFKPSEWTDNINLLGALPIRTASGTIAHFSDGADSVPMKSIVANITPIQEGTGDPSPSNPRPISGTSVLNVEKRGVNLFDKEDENLQISGYISASKIVADVNSLTVFTKCKPNTTYTVSKTAGNRFIVCWHDQIPNVGDTLSGQVIDQQASAITITTGATASYIVAFVFNASVDTSITRAQMLDSIQIEEGSTATTYEPYTGTTTTVNLGQTVYGGTADFIGGTGEETYGVVDLGDLSWSKSGTNRFYSWTIRDLSKHPTSESTIANIYCDSLKVDTYSNVYINGNIDVAISLSKDGAIGVNYTDLASYTATQFKNAVSGYKLVYELATPTDFTFTGQPINSYLGTNNVYVDSGEVLDVEYRADIDLLIAELEN